MTVLACAISHHCDDIAILLITHGAHLDIRDKKGNTPLIQAANKRNLQVIQILLKHGADTRIRNKQGNTALIEAAHEQEFNIIEALIAHDTDPDMAKSINSKDMQYINDHAQKAIRMAKRNKLFGDLGRQNWNTALLLEALEANVLTICIPKELALLIGAYATPYYYKNQRILEQRIEDVQNPQNTTAALAFAVDELVKDPMDDLEDLQRVMPYYRQFKHKKRTHKKDCILC